SGALTFFSRSSIRLLHCASRAIPRLYSSKDFSRETSSFSMFSITVSSCPKSCSRLSFSFFSTLYLLMLRRPALSLCPDTPSRRLRSPLSRSFRPSHTRSDVPPAGPDGYFLYSCRSHPARKRIPDSAFPAETGLSSSLLRGPACASQQ